MYNFPTRAPIFYGGEIIMPYGDRTRAKALRTKGFSTGTGIPVSREALSDRRNYEAAMWYASAVRKGMEEYPTSGRT